MNNSTQFSNPHRLPELRETSPFGRLLGRILLPLTLVVLALLVWAGFYTVEVLDLDLTVPSPTAPANPSEPPPVP